MIDDTLDGAKSTRYSHAARHLMECQSRASAIQDYGPFDTWADTTTAHGRLILTVLGGLAEFEAYLIRARTSGRGNHIVLETPMHRIVFLDRATIAPQIQLRPPPFPTYWSSTSTRCPSRWLSG